MCEISTIVYESTTKSLLIFLFLFGDNKTDREREREDRYGKNKLFNFMETTHVVI